MEGKSLWFPRVWKGRKGFQTITLTCARAQAQARMYPFIS